MIIKLILYILSQIDVRHKKAIDTYPSAIQFVPDQYMTQEMCDKAVNIRPAVLDSVPERYKDSRNE